MSRIALILETFIGEKESSVQAVGWFHADTNKNIKLCFCIHGGSAPFKADIFLAHWATEW